MPTLKLGVTSTEPVPIADVDVADANQAMAFEPLVAVRVAVLPVHLLRLLEGVIFTGAAIAAIGGRKVETVGGKFETAWLAKE